MSLKRLCAILGIMALSLPAWADTASQQVEILWEAPLEGIELVQAQPSGENLMEEMLSKPVAPHAPAPKVVPSLTPPAPSATPSTAPISNDQLIEQMLGRRAVPVAEPQGPVLPREVQGPVQGPPQASVQEPALPPATLSEEAAVLPAPPPPAAPAGQGAWVGTMMFTPEEYRNLQQAIAVYSRKTGQKTSPTANAARVGAVTQPGTPESIGRSPSFYLGSIAYFSPDQWVVWLNTMKFTKESTQDGLSVAAISADNVQILWKAEGLDALIPDWRSKLTYAQSGEFVSSNALVRVSNDGREVRFTLRPNQSFVSARMEIIEGKGHEAR